MALFLVVTNRTRFSTVACLVLTLGMVLNVFGLQGAHRTPLAAIAEAFPTASVRSGSANSPQAPSAGPVKQTLNSADADLSVRAADSGRPAPDPVPTGIPAPDDKLIAAVQRELTDRGYGLGQINGKAGIITRSAIMAFEFDQHFSLTGEPSEELLRRILLSLSGPNQEPALPPSPKAAGIIHGAQLLLQRLGYYTGLINAQLDEPTRKALRRFEADSGLVPKGRIAGDVMAEIVRRAHAHAEAYDEALSR